jgi:hypothetical protein
VHNVGPARASGHEGLLGCRSFIFKKGTRYDLEVKWFIGEILELEESVVNVVKV